MESSNYKGDSIFNIDCTGDACCGDFVSFERATFGGSFRSPKFLGFEKITGEIVKDSYGKAKQQHTFTIKLENGELMRIKGRNLYSNGTWRRIWLDEKQRGAKLDEKHTRGNIARQERNDRLSMF